MADFKAKNDKIVNYCCSIMGTAEKGLAQKYAKKLGYFDDGGQVTLAGEVLVRFCNFNEFLAQSLKTIRKFYNAH